MTASPMESIVTWTSSFSRNIWLTRPRTCVRLANAAPKLSIRNAIPPESLHRLDRRRLSSCLRDCAATAPETASTESIACVARSNHSSPPSAGAPPAIAACARARAGSKSSR